jgi:hypothetical protein
MKTVKKAVLAILFIYSCVLGYSQQIHRSDSSEKAFHQRIIARVPYIFEGKVIKQEYFHGAGDRYGILTCSLVQITKIYKGSPKIVLGTICVVTAQGGPENGFMVYPSEATITLYQGSRYIIFGTPADSTRRHSMPSDNNTTLTIDEPVVFTPHNPITWGQSQYSTTGFDSFFKDCGLTVQVEMKQTPTDSIKH